MSSELKERCRNLLVELGLADPQDEVEAEPLTGGVASDIARVRIGERSYCVKFALSKLKVEADWFAPVHRNAAEYAWLEVASKIAPESAVQLFGRSDTEHGFAMEFLEGEDVYLWKSQLLAETASRGEDAKLGALIGQIHAASTQPDFDQRPFRNRDDFRALRIEPYLTFTATHHPDIADQLHAIASQLYAADQVLVHGDVSPKNILFRESGPVILDAECATMSDACFDPSFCMNHLVLKAVHLPSSRERYLKSVIGLWQAYEPHISWEPTSSVEQRICHLLPALMLGRVDGKSPVEYLNERNRGIVREIARQFFRSPEEKLATLIDKIHESLEEMAA